MSSFFHGRREASVFMCRRRGASTPGVGGVEI